MILTGTQIREARELLGRARAELSFRARLPLAVVAGVEDHGSALMLPRQMAMVAHTLEKAGIEFHTGSGGGARVKLRKREAL